MHTNYPLPCRVNKFSKPVEYHDAFFKQPSLPSLHLTAPAAISMNEIWFKVFASCLLSEPNTINIDPCFDVNKISKPTMR